MPDVEIEFGDIDGTGSAIPSGNEVFPGQDGATTVKWTRPALRRNLGVIPPPPLHERSTDFQFVTPTTDDGRKILDHFLFWGQSLNTGTIALRALSTTALYPDNVLMLPLEDVDPDLYGPNYGPMLATWPIDYNTDPDRPGIAVPIPMVEIFARVNPPAIDPIGGASFTLSGAQLGETWASGLCSTVIRIADASNAERPTIVGSVIGKGGERTSHIDRGSFTHRRILEAIKAVSDYAASEGMGYRLTIFTEHGQDNAIQDEAEQLSYRQTNYQYAGEMVQFRHGIEEDACRVTGLPLKVLLLQVQCGTTFPTNWPPTNLRSASTSDGQIMSSDMDPNIVTLLPDYPAPSVDTVHLYAEGYHYLGCSAAYPAAQVLYGVGRPNPIRPMPMLPKMLTSTVGVIPLMTNYPLRIQEYSIYKYAVASGGADYAAGTEVATTGLQTNGRFEILTAPGGVAATLRKIDGGSHPTDPTGTLSTVVLISGGTVANAGSTPYIDGAFVTLEGGTYRRQARFFVRTNGSGTPTSVELYDAGDYDALPSNPADTTGGGPGASGLTLNIQAVGSGLTIAVTSIKQFALTIANPTVTVNAGGSGYTNGDVLFAAGGTLADDGYPAQFRATVVAGAVTGVVMDRAGQYVTLPDFPMSVTGGTGLGCTLTPAVGAFPVANPGTAGLDALDGVNAFNASNITHVVGANVASVRIIDWQQNPSSAIEFTLDQPALGDVYIGIAQRTQRANGGFCGARTNIAQSPPPGSVEGYWGLMPQQFAARDFIHIPNPFGNDQVTAPLLGNTQFQVASLATSQAMTNTGVYVSDGWRSWRSVSGSTASRVAGDREQYAKRLQRDSGNTSTAAISETFVLTGEDVYKVRGKPLTMAARLLAGSSLSGVVTFRIYSHNAVTSFGTSSFPSGATLMGFGSFTPTTAWADYAFCTDYSGATQRTVPSDAEMLVWMLQRTSAGTAGDADYFDFEAPSLNPGTIPRPFMRVPLALEKLRLGIVDVASRTVTELASRTPVAGRLTYVTDESGGAVPAFGDGTNWRRVTDRSVVS